MKRAWIGVAVLVFLGFAFVRYEYNDSERKKYELERFGIEQKAQYEARELELKSISKESELVRVQFGDVDADLYRRCRTDPPTQPENQEICKSLIVKVKERWAREGRLRTGPW